eukprot:Opistho-1_new@62709
MRTWTQHECPLDKNNCSLTTIPITDNPFALLALAADPRVRLASWRAKGKWGYATQFETPAAAPDLEFPTHQFSLDDAGQSLTLAITLPRDIAAVQYSFSFSNATVSHFTVSVDDGAPSDPFGPNELGLFVQAGYRVSASGECVVRVTFALDGWTSSSRAVVSGVAKSALSTDVVDGFESRLPDWAMAGLDLFPINVVVELAYP